MDASAAADVAGVAQPPAGAPRQGETPRARESPLAAAGVRAARFGVADVGQHAGGTRRNRASPRSEGALAPGGA